METEEKNWGAESWRAPAMKDGDFLLFSECGRSLDGVCYRSFWFKVVRDAYGHYYLLVKHGGGQERIDIGFKSRLMDAFNALDSDTRYLLMFTLYRINADAMVNATERTAARYQKAFVNGTLKKRKARGQQGFRVWIEDSQSQILV